MEKTYRCNYLFLFLNIVFVSIGFLLLFIAAIRLSATHTKLYVSIFVMIIIYTFLLYWFISVARKKMYLNDKRILILFRNQKWDIPWDHIRRIQYLGKPYLFSERILICTDNISPGVDLFTKDHISIWKEVCQKAQEANKEVLIDQDLLERLSI